MNTIFNTKRKLNESGSSFRKRINDMNKEAAMNKYRVEGIAKVAVVTFVEANSYKEAEKIASERELDICIHGSEMQGNEDSEEFTLTDGSYYSIDNLDAEEANQ